jgi:thioredoxin-like negative regulator of GroEL
MGRLFNGIGRSLMLACTLALLCVPGWADEINYVESDEGNPELPSTAGAGELELPLLPDEPPAAEPEEAPAPEPEELPAEEPVTDEPVQSEPAETVEDEPIIAKPEAAPIEEQAPPQTNYTPPQETVALPSVDAATATEDNSSEIEMLRSMAENAMREERYPEAVELYNQAIALQQNGGTVEMRTALARALALAGRRDEAFALIDQIYSTRRDYATAQLAKADILIELGQRSEALDIAEQLLVHEPDNLKALALRHELTGGNVASPAEPSADLTTLREAAEANPRDSAAQLALGQGALNAGDYTTAVGAFGRVLELDADLHAAQLGLARAYLYDGDHETAIAEFCALAEIPGLDPELYAQGVAGHASALRAAGRRDEAERKFQEALSYRGDDMDLRLAYAYTLAENRQLERSLYQLSIIERAQPENQQVRLAAARANAWNGELETALMHYNSIDDPALEADALLGRAYVEYWMGDRKAAKQTLACVCAVNPDHPDAHTLQSLLTDTPSPSLAVTQRGTEDSEDNTYTGLTAVLNIPLGPEGTAIFVTHEDFKLENTGATPLESEGTHTRVGINARLNDDTTVSGYVGKLDIDNGTDPATDNTNYGAALTTKLADEWSFTAGLNSQMLYDTPELARNGVVLDSYDFSTVFGILDDDTTLALDYSTGELSDGNSRQSYGFNLRRSTIFDRRGELAYGVQGRYLSFADDLDNGYFDPDKYQFTEVYLDWQDRSDNVLKFDASLGVGVDKVEDEDLRNTLRWALGLRAEVTDDITLRAGVADSDQASTAATTGQSYNFRTWYVNGEWVF